MSSKRGVPSAPPTDAPATTWEEGKYVTVHGTSRVIGKAWTVGEVRPRLALHARTIASMTLIMAMQLMCRSWKE